MLNKNETPFSPIKKSQTVCVPDRGGEKRVDRNAAMERSMTPRPARKYFTPPFSCRRAEKGAPKTPSITVTP